MKTLRKATEQEVLEIAKQEWQGDERMQDFIIKKYDYYFTNDNYILEFEKPSKLSITKDFYYDDETDAPDITLENFLNNNKMNCNGYNCLKEESQRTKIHLCNGGNVYSYLDYNRYGDEIRNSKRVLEDDELADILEIYKEQKEKYTERLTKYFNKYKNKIGCIGYWANR